MHKIIILILSSSGEIYSKFKYLQTKYLSIFEPFIKFYFIEFNENQTTDVIEINNTLSFKGSESITPGMIIKTSLAIDYLKKAKPVKPLKLNKILSNVALNHAEDLNKNNLYESVGSDGSLPDKRIQRRIVYKGKIGESLDFNFLSAEDIVYSCLVDDGLNDRSRRINFFSQFYNYIGIGISEHPDYFNCCVIDYIEEIKEYVSNEDEGKKIL